MDLKTYLATAPRGSAKKLSSGLGVSMSYLSQMASGDAAVSPERCVLMEKLTEGAVTRRDQFPETWHLIWPELATLGLCASDRPIEGNLIA